MRVLGSVRVVGFRARVFGVGHFGLGLSSSASAFRVRASRLGIRVRVRVFGLGLRSQGWLGF